MKRLAPVLISLLVIAAAAAFFLTRVPTPPSIATQGLDPLIAKSINDGIAEVRQSQRSAAAWGKLAMILKASSFNPEALQCFEQAEKLDPNDVRWPYFQTSLLFPARVPEALAKMRRATLLSREDFLQLRLGQMLAEAGQISEAEQVFRRIAPPSHPGANLGLALINHAHGKWADTIEHLKFCLTDEHTAKAAAVLLASAQLRIGEAAAAQATSRHALDLPPDRDWPNSFESEIAKCQVGLRPLVEECQRLLGANRVDEALAPIDKLLKLYPRAAEGWLYLGRARLMKGNLTEAEKALTQHLQLDPASFDGHLQLGLALHRHNRLADAATEFQEALNAKPDAETAHYFLGVTHLQQGDTNAALQSFRQALRYQPSYTPAQKAADDLLGRQRP